MICRLLLPNRKLKLVKFVRWIQWNDEYPEIRDEVIPESLDNGCNHFGKLWLRLQISFHCRTLLVNLQFNGNMFQCPLSVYGIRIQVIQCLMNSFISIHPVYIHHFCFPLYFPDFFFCWSKWWGYWTSPGFQLFQRSALNWLIASCLVFFHICNSVCQINFRPMVIWVNPGLHRTCSSIQWQFSGWRFKSIEYGLLRNNWI